MGVQPAGAPPKAALAVFPSGSSGAQGLHTHVQSGAGPPETLEPLPALILGR